MSTRQVSPFSLLVKSLSQVLPIYLYLLAFLIPNLIFFIISAFSDDTQSVLVSIVDNIKNFIVFPFVDGAATFYAYQRLRRTTFTIPDALQRAGEKYISLFLVNLFNEAALNGIFALAESVKENLSLFWLFPPLFYIMICLSCITYVIVIEDRNISQAASRSWELVADKWWYVTRTGFYAALIYIGMLCILWLVTRDLLRLEVLGEIAVFLSFPITTVYEVLVFMSLLNTASSNN